MIYSVFVSSTYLDNMDRRKKVENAILRAEMLPIGMERFGGSAERSVDYCQKKAREADMLVGIIAWRYGWIPSGHDISITELEYDAASERLMFLPDQSMRLDPENDYDDPPDRWDKQKKLDAFKARIADDQMAARFNDENLEAVVPQSLIAWREQKDGKERAPEQEKQELKAIASTIVETGVTWRSRYWHGVEFFTVWIHTKRARLGWARPRPGPSTAGGRRWLGHWKP